MNEQTLDTVSGPRDVTEDFLLCNRCGTCRAVCPVFLVLREEGASARGKVELAEAFFRGAEVDARKLQQVFDLCLHCMSCEESCPSGMRADEIIMAVRAEMARRGLIPRPKRLALRFLEKMDNALFKTMRSLGLVRRAPLHGVGGKSPLRVFFPLLGWPRERFVPLPKDKPFIGSRPELFEASSAEYALPNPDEARRIVAATGQPASVAGTGGYTERSRAVRDGAIDPAKTADLVRRIAAARERNLAEHRRAYYFVGHAVNHFFPEEAEAVVRILNLLGIDVLVPRDQVCCGAPAYYAGDIDGARRLAAATLERFAGHRYDWIVTSCSSGGLMLKEEFPRLFDLTADGFFEIAWDHEMEKFRRVPNASATRKAHPRAADLYEEFVKGRVYDINELLARMLGFKEKASGIEALFADAGGHHEETAAGTDESDDSMPIVTYHHPCHLNRGQSVAWQPEALLEALPGHRYIEMTDADRCCGGGGAFTFVYADTSAEIAEKKLDAVGAVRPDVVATACPVCRIQLMDMLHRRFVLEARRRGEEPRTIPVKTPVELLLEDLEPVLRVADSRPRS
jgi:glycolate oxidase iron-sulfur subunit